MAKNFTVRLVYGGQRAVCPPGLARQVLRHFGDTPHFASFLTQCLAEFDAQKEVNEFPSDMYTAMLRVMRQELTNRFGKYVRAGDAWHTVLRDVDPVRAQAVLTRFGLHDPFGRENLVAEVTSKGLDRLWLANADAKASMECGLTAVGLLPKEKGDVDRLADMTFLVWMVTVVPPLQSTERMGVVHRTQCFATLVDRLLAPDAPTAHEAPVPHLRLVVNND